MLIISTLAALAAVLGVFESMLPILTAIPMENSVLQTA